MVTEKIDEQLNGRYLTQLYTRQIRTRTSNCVYRTLARQRRLPKLGVCYKPQKLLWYAASPAAHVFQCRLHSRYLTTCLGSGARTSTRSSSKSTTQAATLRVASETWEHPSVLRLEPAAGSQLSRQCWRSRFFPPSNQCRLFHSQRRSNVGFHAKKPRACAPK